MGYFSSTLFAAVNSLEVRGRGGGRERGGERGRGGGEKERILLIHVALEAVHSITHDNFEEG